ncbi:MAG: SUMF1/EgtB/PvdO family nonheme iron enzyme [Nitrosomonas sp.]|jgi:formylglycine-generating enzyme required for sulfatase activity|uniref:SUMF1/EgtB/PvdO family nonheme iron enzyme n=1 Tax=Nitrosomonas sp. TaxID=42353 RepID=UPI001D6EE08A|nr:SUMF1/EgtB/PvdO family nonheme iron enzyme [Nitrosomonas sp.]MBX9893979.1 SUMF1/EgtB/PvdO family nonheme iron enzyme [Nitrosomonas sp.]
MAKIFINYRRDDSAGYAGRLYDRLNEHFGGEHVFMDIDQIEPGEDFVEVIQEKLKAVQVAVALIGKHWLDITDANGQRRLDNPEDWVRLEIEALLARKIRVIPLLVGGANAPNSSRLPGSLAALARRQAHAISDRGFHEDVNKLIRVLEKDLQANETAKPSSVPDAAQPPEVKLPAVRLPFEPEMVRIPAGKFLMGSKDGELNEQPVHEVIIGYAFEIGKYAVTFDEYDAFVRATGCVLPNDCGWGRGKRPVINVSWHDAQGYVKWLSDKTSKRYRLSSEAEWEYAAKAGLQTRYWWGDDIGKNNANCKDCGNQWDGKQTVPVGSFKSNAFGLYDTAGNVWEWTQDCWHHNYTNAPTDGSAWLEKDDGDCKGRVVRGGSWNYDPWNLRSAGRGRYGTDDVNNNLGFRIARDF